MATRWRCVATDATGVAEAVQSRVPLERKRCRDEVVPLFSLPGFEACWIVRACAHDHLMTAPDYRLRASAGAMSGGGFNEPYPQT